MSTRSITEFYIGETRVCAFYRHFDGYPSGHGMDLFKALQMRIVNGKGSNWDPETMVNGPGRLISHVIAWFWNHGHEPDLIELDSSEKLPDQWQEYEYTVTIGCSSPWAITVEVREVFTSTSLFRGPPECFGAWLAHRKE